MRVQKRTKSDLIVTRLESEFVVYDRVHDSAHVLTKVHYQILVSDWPEDIDTLAGRIFAGEPPERARALFEAGVSQLLEAKLLLPMDDLYLSRRSFLRGSLSAAALPVIISLAVPTPAAADSLGTQVFSASNPAFAVPPAANALTFENIGGGGGGGGNGAGLGGVGGVGSRGATATGGPVSIGATINVVVGACGTGGANGLLANGGAGGSLGGQNGFPRVSGSGRGGGGGSSSIVGATSGQPGDSGQFGGSGGAGGSSGSNVGGDGGDGGSGNIAERGAFGTPGRGGGILGPLRDGEPGQVTVTFCRI